MINKLTLLAKSALRISSMENFKAAVFRARGLEEYSGLKVIRVGGEEAEVVSRLVPSPLDSRVVVAGIWVCSLSDADEDADDIGEQGAERPNEPTDEADAGDICSSRVSRLESMIRLTIKLFSRSSIIFCFDLKIKNFFPKINENKREEKEKGGYFKLQVSLLHHQK